MSTPMSYISPTEFMCALCFGGFPLEEATWDMHHSDPPVRVNVCMQCRIGETYWMIKKFASYS